MESVFLTNEEALKKLKEVSEGAYAVQDNLNISKLTGDEAEEVLTSVTDVLANLNNIFTAVIQQFTFGENYKTRTAAEVKV